MYITLEIGINMILLFYSLDFHLSSGGITMDEVSHLKDYNVVDGDDVLLIPASIAG